MFRRLLPKETNFFDYFERHSRLGMEACKEMDALSSNPAELHPRVDRIKEIEHEADAIAHECIDAIHRTFITPIDRADIHRLIRRLDDIVDAVDSAAARMMMYELTTTRPELTQLSATLVRASQEIDGALRHLRHLGKNGPAIDRFCQGVYDAEKQGDEILKVALVRLFQEEKEPVLLIKWKEVFERLERATDRCEEVANIIQGIVIEAS